MSEIITEKFIVKKSYGVGHLQPAEINRLQIIVDKLYTQGKKVTTGRELLFLLMDYFENSNNTAIDGKENAELKAENEKLSTQINELAKIDVQAIRADNDNLRAELETVKEAHDNYVKDIEGQDETFNTTSLILKKDHPGTKLFINFSSYHISNNLTYTDGMRPATEEDVLEQIMRFLPISNINKKYLPK